MGLMFLAAILVREGYNVKIIDAYLERLNQLKLSKKILIQNPDIVGITTDSCNFYESIRIAKLVKNVTHALVVLGGPHATIRAKEIINYPEVDVVVIGEGENTLLEIVNRLENGKSLEGCKGCFFKENGKKKFNPFRERIKNFDTLPFPARHLLPYKKYPRLYSSGGLKAPIDTISTSRGCPYNCSFCSSRIIWGKTYQHRSPKKVVDEIEFLINEYDTNGVYFREDNFTLKKNHVIGICEELRRRKIDIEWECSSRVDLVDKTLLKIMARAGCKSIWYGVESGSQKTLEKINKGITLEKSRKAVKLSREVGINVGGSFIIGIPGETKEDINKTIQFIKELKLTPSAIHYFYGIPDSALYREVIDNNWIDSAYGDILFVKTPEFNKRSLQKIINSVRRDLWFYNIKSKLKQKPLNAVKFSISAIKQPKKLLSLLRNF